jgi:hypothetical protein
MNDEERDARTAREDYESEQYDVDKDRAALEAYERAQLKEQLMSFSTKELEAMLAFAKGFSEGENNRWYLNEYLAAGQDYTAYALGYEAGKHPRGR